LYLSEILYTYQFRCNFVHGDLTPDNIIINFDYIYNVIHDLKIIDFGSSSIQVKINKKSVLIYDNSKKSDKTYLDTLSSFTNRSFALSSDLFYFYILILFHSSYGLNIMSDDLRSELIRIFGLDIHIDYIEEYKKYAIEYYYRQRPNNKNLAEINIEYYVKSYPIKFLCKLKHFRDHFFGIEYYKFHPISFRNNLLKNLHENIDFFINNSLNENIKLKNIIDRIELKTKLEYLQLYGINNIFGINTKTKLILLDLIFATLYSTDINEKCKYMDIMNLLITDSINNNNQYNVIKKLTIGKGGVGTVNYININNKVLKKQVFSKDRVRSVITSIFEYIFGYYICYNLEVEFKKNIPKTFCLYIHNNKLFILMEYINKQNKIALEYFGNNLIVKNFYKIIINLCNVLVYLQNKFKFIHNDLHLENFFVKKDLDIILIDFRYASLNIITPNGNKVFKSFYMNLFESRPGIILHKYYSYEDMYSRSFDIIYLFSSIIYYYRYDDIFKSFPREIINILYIKFYNNGEFINKLLHIFNKNEKNLNELNELINIKNPLEMNKFKSKIQGRVEQKELNNKLQEMWNKLVSIKYQSKLKFFIELLNNKNIINNFIPENVIHIFNSLSNDNF